MHTEKSKKTTGGRKQAVPRRRGQGRTAIRSPRAAAASSSPRKAARIMPLWMRNALAAVLVVLFSAGFYWFFIRPYAYRWKPCYGLKGYGVCLPCRYEVHGIDISHYQGDIDWALLARQREGEFPLRFVFMKATEGGDHADEAFARNFRQARRYGFVRGAYHFFNPRTDALRQADFFIRTVPLDSADLPPVLDVETTGGKNRDELQQGVLAWLRRVEAHYGVKPILYTGYKFKLRYLNDSAFLSYPYWIAHYYVDSVRYEGPWRFWQHTDAGIVPGIEGNVDLNVFNGTAEGLDSLCLRNRR